MTRRSSLALALAAGALAAGCGAHASSSTSATRAQSFSTAQLPAAQAASLRARSMALLGKIARLSVTPKDLQGAGMAASEARAEVRALTPLWRTLRGRAYAIGSLQLTPGTGSAITLSTTASYTRSPSGAPPLNALITLTYTRANGRFVLSDASLSFVR